MKTIITVILLFAFALFHLPAALAHAQTESTDGAMVTESSRSAQSTDYLKKLDISTVSAEIQFSFLGLPAPLILPDSPLYFLVTTYEQVRLFLTTDPNSKALLSFQIAERRLAEAYKLAEKGRGDLSQESLLKYQETLVSLVESLKESKLEGNDVLGLLRKVEANVMKEYRVSDYITQKFDTTKNEIAGRAQDISAESLLKVLELAAAVKESTPSTEFQEKVRLTVMSEAVESEVRKRLVQVWQENFAPKESSVSAGDE